MNKRGQTLIIFVMLIPIILTMAALVIDVGLLYYKKNEYTGIVEESIKEYFKDEETDRKKILYSKSSCFYSCDRCCCGCDIQ